MKVLTICAVIGIVVCICYGEWGGAVGWLFLMGVFWLLASRPRTKAAIKKKPVKRKASVTRKKRKRHFEVKQPWEARFFR